MGINVPKYWPTPEEYKQYYEAQFGKPEPEEEEEKEGDKLPGHNSFDRTFDNSRLGSDALLINQTLPVFRKGIPESIMKPQQLREANKLLGFREFDPVPEDPSFVGKGRAMPSTPAYHHFSEENILKRKEARDEEVKGVISPNRPLYRVTPQE